MAGDQFLSDELLGQSCRGDMVEQILLPQLQVDRHRQRLCSKPMSSRAALNRSLALAPSGRPEGSQ